MTELTNAQLHQIREALKTGIELTPTYRTGNPARDELQAALDIVTKLLEVPAKVETAPVAKVITFGMVDEYRPMGANKIERAALWYDGKEYKQKTFDTRKEAIEFLKSINVPYKTRSEYCALKAQNS